MRNKPHRDTTFNVREMLSLYIAGATLVDLGHKYHKDHTTILYHCKKWGVAGNIHSTTYKRSESVTVGTLPDIIFSEKETQPDYQPPPKKPKPHKYDDLLNEKTQPGKSYQQYLKEARERDVWYRTYTPEHHLTSAPARPKEEGSRGDAKGAGVAPGERATDMRDRDKSR